MSKSRVSPNFCLYQIVVKDYKHLKPPPPSNRHYVDKSGNGVYELYEEDGVVPVITKLKWAKNHKRAMAWARKFGSIISCRKVDSHIRRLDMINYLRIEPKPVEVDISPDEFILGRDLEIEPTVKTKKIEINRNEAIDK